MLTCGHRSKWLVRLRTQCSQHTTFQNLSSLFHKNGSRKSSPDPLTMLGGPSRRASNDPLLVHSLLGLPPIPPLNGRQTAVTRLSVIVHMGDLFPEERVLPRLQLFLMFAEGRRSDLGRMRDIGSREIWHCGP